MILFDEVVTLRAIDENDASVLMNLINDPEVENSVVGYSWPVSLSQQKKWIAGLSDDKNIRYAIDAGKGIVGVASVSSLDLKNRTGNMNIKLVREARGNGYAIHAVKLLIKYCFEELNLNCLSANVIERNADSKKLWEKLGFELEGVLRQRVYKNDEYHNLLAYSLLRKEFDERNW